MFCDGGRTLQVGVVWRREKQDIDVTRNKSRRRSGCWESGVPETHVVRVRRKETFTEESLWEELEGLGLGGQNPSIVTRGDEVSMTGSTSKSYYTY